MRSLRFALLLAALTALPARCAELVVGAPRELAECVDALSAAFLAGEKDLRLRFVMDTNEKLYEKVSAGAPLDVYMSSHMALQGQLLADGKMAYDSWTMYATGRIVLWSLDKRIEVGKGIELLSNPALKLATVNGGNPYLLASLTAIQQAGLLNKLQPLEGDNMQSLVQAVKDRKAQLAILSYETVLASSMKGVGHYHLLPEGEIVGHAAVVTLHGKPNPAAYRFVRFLKTAKAQAILTPKGFMKPPLEAVNVR